jgi:hypothetical protein
MSVLGTGIARSSGRILSCAFAAANMICGHMYGTESR